MKKNISFIALAATIILCVWIFSFDYNYPPNYEIKGFEFLTQPDNITCGPTSALMVLKRYGINSDIEEVKNKTKTQWFKSDDKPVGMTSPELIPVALRKIGLSSRMLLGDIDRLKYYVSERRPVIVLLRSGEFTWHYVVVIGYAENKIIVADPGWGREVEIETNDFLKSWNFETDMRGKKCGHKSLVLLLKIAEVHPNTMIVPSNSLSDE